MIRIGKIVATHSLQGTMVLTHIAGNSKWLRKESVIFLELQKESYIPFFVTHAKPNNNEEYTINLEDVNTLEAARKLIGKNVYVQDELIVKYAADTPILWIGFNMIDKENGKLGMIEDIYHTASQWLAKLTYKEKEILVPIIEQTIDRVNMKSKTVYVNLPDGLLDVYLG